jgi:hypothetical protein
VLAAALGILVLDYELSAGASFGAFAARGRTARFRAARGAAFLVATFPLAFALAGRPARTRRAALPAFEVPAACLFSFSARRFLQYAFIRRLVAWRAAALIPRRRDAPDFGAAEEPSSTVRTAAIR